MRRTVAAVVVALAALPACGGASPPASETSVDAFEVRIVELQRDVAAVVALQADEVPMLAPALETLRAVDAILPRVLDEDTIDDALDRVPEAGAALGGVDVAPARAAARDVASAVDEARGSLRGALRVVADPGDRAYLEAEDEVLVAVRRHAEQTDALAQVIGQHLGSYVAVQAALTDFAERRSRFRSASEAADALALEIDDLLAAIAVAQTDVATYVAARRDAAVEVNLTQDRATAAWQARGVPVGELPGEEIGGSDPAPTDGG